MPAMLLQTVLVTAFAFAMPLSGQNREAANQPGSAWFEPAGKSSIVSADLLRHPISSRTRGMLHRALDWMRSGDHEKAIRQLRGTLAKDPSSAAYVHSLLAYELMRTGQVTAAISSFEQAVSLLPHDPANHHNFAVSLVLAGDYERAEEEESRAHDLAPDDSMIRRFLEALRAHRESRHGTLSARTGSN